MNSAFDIASTMLGKQEGPQRAAIQDYLRTGGANLDPSVAAWCAAFVNSSLQQAGMKGTGSNMARSFLNFGKAVNQPARGDIAVFSRGSNPLYGHVGFFNGYGPDGKIQVLGGNQGNSVSIASFDPRQLLGFRRPDGTPAGAVAAPPQGQLASNFRLDSFEKEPSLGGLLTEALPATQPGEKQKADAAERARREALFGQGGVADMFA